MQEIIVDNCHDCPFANNDNEYGKDQCNLNTDIVCNGSDELPHYKVHKDCPLKNNSFTIKLQ